MKKNTFYLNEIYQFDHHLIGGQFVFSLIIGNEYFPTLTMN
jgi:hypothetical protein